MFFLTPNLTRLTDKSRVKTNVILFFVLVLVLSSRNVFMALDLSDVHMDSRVYIRSNGLVEGTDRIISTDNVTYIFVGDINGSIVVQKDNIVIDGSGRTLIGSGLYGPVGIDLQDRSNVTIRNLSLTGFYVCISLNLTSNTAILGNRIVTAINRSIEHESGIGKGMVIQDSSGNIVSGNQIEENAEAIRVRGKSFHNIISDNNLTNNAYGLTLSCPDNEVCRNIFANHNICGFYAFAANNVTITANNIVDNKNYSEHGAWGILLHNCNNSAVVDNNFTDNEIAFEMHDSCNNTISGNNVARNVGPFHFDGSGHNICGNSFTNNTNYGLIAALVNNCTISDNSFDGNAAVGINVDEGESIMISGNVIRNTQKDITNQAYPIELLNVSRSKIIKNNISSNADTVKIHLCADSVFDGNIIGNNNAAGLYISISGNCTFSSNYLFNNSDAGIQIWCSNGSSFVNNRIQDCGVGISASYSFGNKIFHNDFVNNIEQVHSVGSANNWDDGYPSGGNFWSEYSGVDYFSGPYQNETGSDKMGDSPYAIDANNADYYPTMNPIAVPEFPVFILLFFIAATLLSIVGCKAISAHGLGLCVRSKARVS